MRRFRRLTALVLSTVLLQLTLGGLGMGCGDHGRGSEMAASGPARHHMAGMPQEPGGAGARPCHEQRGGEHDAGSPCQMPGTQGACVSMTTCAAPMLAAAATHTTLTADRVPVRASVETLLVGSPAAPELPPPRA